MRWIALLLVGLLALSGCIGDPDVPKLRVENRSGQVLLVGPRVEGPDASRERVEPGQTIAFYPQRQGCESRPWVATTPSNEILAELPGACVEHRWTVTGPTASTYE